MDFVNVSDRGGDVGAAPLRSRLEPYRVDLAPSEAATPSAVFLHCLPAHHDNEVTDEVAGHPRSRVFDQAENRRRAFKALLLHLTG